MKTIKARYQAGKLEPLEPLVLFELLTIEQLFPGAGGGRERIERLGRLRLGDRDLHLGAWKELLDCEQFEKDVYESRLTHPRPEVRW